MGWMYLASASMRVMSGRAGLLLRCGVDLSFGS